MATALDLQPADTVLGPGPAHCLYRGINPYLLRFARRVEGEKKQVVPVTGKKHRGAGADAIHRCRQKHPIGIIQNIRDLLIENGVVLGSGVGFGHGSRTVGARPRY